MIECIQRVITNIVERVGMQGVAKESLRTVPREFKGLEGVWDTKIKASGKEWSLSGFEVGIGPMSGSWSVPTSTLE